MEIIKRIRETAERIMAARARMIREARREIEKVKKSERVEEFTVAIEEVSRQMARTIRKIEQEKKSCRDLHGSTALRITTGNYMESQ